MGDIPLITRDQFILEKPIDGMRKIMGSSLAATKRVIGSGSVIPSSSSSSAPSINAKIVKLQECPKIFDKEPRKAKFAIRATDLGSWKSSSSSSRSGQGSTNSDPKTIQHWALVVYFPECQTINLFEAVNDDGQLQACRAQIAFEDIEIFNKADYIGEAETSPCQLLQIAKQVKTKWYNTYYSALFNNCQTWLKEFLKQINIACGSGLSLPHKYLNGLTN